MATVGACSYGCQADRNRWSRTTHRQARYRGCHDRHRCTVRRIAALKLDHSRRGRLRIGNERPRRRTPPSSHRAGRWQPLRPATLRPRKEGSADAHGRTGKFHRCHHSAADPEPDAGDGRVDLRPRGRGVHRRRGVLLAEMPRTVGRQALSLSRLDVFGHASVHHKGTRRAPAPARHLAHGPGGAVGGTTLVRRLDRGAPRGHQRDLATGSGHQDPGFLHLNPRSRARSSGR